MLATAIFAAGCFWGIQAVYESVPGVVATEVGYTGGTQANPSYAEVCTGTTGHAESIKITYDPDIISYSALLDILFGAHNPTTLNRQGPDVGTQYRSAIFYLNEDQKNIALSKIKELNKSGKFAAPIVTEVTAAGPFYPAEQYHQKYLQKRGQTNCRLR